jgi:HPt (histidine-containing phosphotransfer) domain-containing protein
MSSVTAQRPVDLAHLARYTAGETALNAEVLGLFVEQMAPLLRGFQESLETPDARVWRESAHALKGAALGIGAFALAEAAADAESIDPATAPTSAARALRALDLRCRVVRKFVAAYLGR